MLWKLSLSMSLKSFDGMSYVRSITSLVSHTVIPLADRLTDGWIAFTWHEAHVWPLLAALSAFVCHCSEHYLELQCQCSAITVPFHCQCQCLCRRTVPSVSMDGLLWRMAQTAHRGFAAINDSEIERHPHNRQVFYRTALRVILLQFWRLLQRIPWIRGLIECIK